jgi:hypothetical protein
MGNQGTDNGAPLEKDVKAGQGTESRMETPSLKDPMCLVDALYLNSLTQEELQEVCNACLENIQAMIESLEDSQEMCRKRLNLYDRRHTKLRTIVIAITGLVAFINLIAGSVPIHVCKWVFEDPKPLTILAAILAVVAATSQSLESSFGFAEKKVHFHELWNRTVNIFLEAQMLKALYLSHPANLKADRVMKVIEVYGRLLERDRELRQQVAKITSQEPKEAKTQ